MIRLYNWFIGLFTENKINKTNDEISLINDEYLKLIKRKGDV